MSSVNNEKKYVATYKEIALIFVIFSLVLFILYPKDLLKEQILSERANYDLSMLYLQNMLENDPTNETLMITLATQSLRSGKKDLAYKLLDLLKNSEDINVTKKAYRESYILAKDDFFYFEAKKNIKKKEKQSLVLKELYDTIYKQKFYEQSEYRYMFKEALFLRDYKRAYEFIMLSKIPREEKVNKLEEVYYIAIEHKDYREAIKAIHQELKLDSSHLKKWREAELYVLEQSASKKELIAYLNVKAKKSTYWKIKLAKYYFRIKYFNSSAKIYMQLFKGEKNYNKKRSYFLKAIEALNAGRYQEKAVYLAKRYENYYFKDRYMRKYLLKLYIANNKAEYAAQLSKKILLRGL